MGVPDATEAMFWNAVRDGDDAARASAVAQLQADVARDPTNGYSQFLIGASMFMAPSPVLKALAAGGPPVLVPPDPAAAPYLTKAMSNLMDPFYLGFDGALLGALQMSAGDVATGQQTFGAAVPNNHVATGLVSVINDLLQQNPSDALSDLYSLMEYCNGGMLDRSGADAVAYVRKQNTGTLAQRECYSGYYAMHGSEGMLLVAGDLHALGGNAQAAMAYYTALQSDTNYATWPLKPLVERRLAGTQVAQLSTTSVITATCATCHTNTLP
jgi:hypothetical protein